MAKKKKPKINRRIIRKRPCRLCRDKIQSVDYREVNFINRFISDRGRIISSRITGNCAKHQRIVAKAIKRARIASLVPYLKIKEGLQRRRPTRDRDSRDK